MRRYSNHSIQQRWTTTVLERISGKFVRLQALAFFVEDAVKTVYRTDSEIMVKRLLTLGIVIDNILTHSIS